MRPRILVVDDEENILFSFKAFFDREGYETVTAADYDSAMQHLAQGSFDVIVSDIVLGPRTGTELLRAIRETGIGTPVIMITGVPQIATAAESVRLGAFDYVRKPVDREMAVRMVNQALRYKSLNDEKETYRRNLEATFRSIQEGIMTVNTDMIVIESNDGIERFIHQKPSNIKNRKLTDCIHANQNECAQVLQKTLATRETIREYRVEWTDNRERNQIVIMNTAPLFSADSSFIGAVLVMRDVTRLTDLERRLEDRYHFHRLIGKSKKMQEIYGLVETLGSTDTTVLLTGETGTGKELIAEALHYGSNRALKPFIKTNCSVLTETLLESELFGHVKGAFTGAIKDKPGRFELADGGTILLDEIGDISPATQLKLLRVLQEREFERVGDHKTVKVDVRVIAATNKNLADQVQLGFFRQDLYYRIKVMEITVPPLRDRKDDIPLLINHFCAQFNKKLRKNIQGVSDEPLKLFLNYNWPGNIRELEHVLEHAFVLCKGDTITSEHLPAELFSAARTTGAPTPFSQDAILRILEKTHWNIAQAARELGISRPTLYKKIKDLNINK